MRRQNLVFVAFTTVAFTWSAAAQTPPQSNGTAAVKLEFKLKPGTQLIYKVSGETREHAEGDATGIALSSGTSRALFVVAEVDESTGTMLIGQLPVLEDEAGKGSGSMSQIASVCHVDRSGSLTPWETKGCATTGRKAVPIAELSLGAFGGVPLPSGPVAPGAEWRTTMNASSGNKPAWSKVESKLVEIKTVDGHKCAVLHSNIVPGKTPSGDGTSNETAGGEMEMLFDVDGGFYRWSKITTRLQFKAHAPSIITEMTFTLERQDFLAQEEASKAGGMIRALDEAIGALHQGDYAKAAEAIERLKPDSVPDAWKAGIAEAAAKVKQVVQMGTDPAERLYDEAAEAQANQEWSRAVARYKECAGKFPENPWCASALMQAGQISETNLGDKSSADDLRRQAIAIQERRAAKEVSRLFGLAGMYEKCGDLGKALATYRRLLAAEEPQITAAMRLRAQCCIGDLLAKEGKTAEAIDAYKAVAAMPGDDSGCAMAKYAAKVKIAVLNATPDK